MTRLKNYRYRKKNMIRLKIYFEHENAKIILFLRRQVKHSIYFFKSIIFIIYRVFPVYS